MSNKNKTKLSLDDFITGSGGGKNKQRQPVEAPNSLQSRATIKVVEVLSEGQVVGVVGGMKGVFLDETPIQAPNDSFNFPAVVYDERFGTPNQDYLPGFSGTESAIMVNTEITGGYGDGIIRSTTSNNVDAVRIQIRLPQGLSQLMKTNGDLNGYRVGIAVDTRPVGGTWTQAFQKYLVGKSTTPYEESFRIEKPAGISTAWEIRVQRMDATAGSAEIADRVDWFAMTEIQDIKVAYENAAVVGLAFDAESTGGAVPRRSYLMDGIIMQVPTNYTPTVYNADGSVLSYASYTGAWNGTFKLSWCDDPAWVLYDILTNERYGMGLHIDASTIDIYSFYEASQYNCELIDNGDGTGTLEPRFRFNAPLQSREDAFKVIQSVAATMRAAVFSGPGYLKIIQDRPSLPVATINNSNVIDGQFTYTGADLSSRITAVDVTYNDGTNRYLPATVSEEASAAMLSAYGYNKIEMTGIGIIHESQARRMAKWVIDNATHINDVVSFTVSWNNAFVEVGDVVNIADNWYAAEQFSGIVKAGGSGVDQIKLDRTVTVNAGQTIHFMTFAGVEHSRTIATSTTGDTLSLVSVEGAVNPSLYAGVPFSILGEVTPRQFKIATVKETEPGKYELSATYHDPSKYARIESGVYVEPPVFTKIEAGSIASPANLTITPESYIDSNGVIKYRLRFNWDDVSNPMLKGYKLRYRRNSNSYVWTDMLPQSEYVLNNAEIGVYEADVYAYNTINVQSPPLSGYYAFNTLGEDPSPIAAPTALALVGGGTAFTGPKFDITWTAAPLITEATFKEYCIDILNGTNVVKTIFQPTVGLTITNAEMVAWAGSAIRNIKVRIRVRDTLKRYSLPVEATFTNAAPAVPVNPTVSTQWQYYVVNHNAVPGTDIAGYKIFHSTSSGFTPSANTLAKTDNGVSHFVEATPDTTYYIKVAAFDTWGSDELNYSAEMSVTTLTEDTLATEIANRIAADAQAAIDFNNALEAESLALAASIANEETARANAITNEANARTAAILAETNARIAAIDDEASARAQALLDLSDAIGTSINNERILRESADSSLAQSIATIIAGTSEQFDTKDVWYFDSSLEAWTGNGSPTVTGGFLRPANHASDPYVKSPVGIALDAASYKYVKLRIKRTGTPTWDGALYWRNVGDGASTWSGPVLFEEPVFVGGLATITVPSIGWTGTVDQIRIDLSTIQTATDYFEIDWVATGRPSPGASVAALEEERQARITGDTAESTARTTLASQLRGGYTGTDINQLTSGLLFNERQARSTADSAMSSDITSLKSTVNNATTGVVATSNAVSALTTRVTNVEGVNNSQGSSITSLENIVNNATTGVAATASGLSALTTRVTNAENTNTSQGNAITSLQNTVNDPTTGVAATSSGLSALTTRVTNAENTNTSQSTAITNLQASVGTKNTNFAQPSPPPTTGRVVNDLWVDTDDNNKLYMWSGSAWVARPGAASNKTWAQPTMPPATGNTVNDLWIDTDDNNKLYRWSGTDWVQSDDGRISSNASAITNLDVRVTNTENTNTSQSTAITNLQSTVNNPSTGVNATASGLSALRTRVTNTENTNASQGSAITTLQNTVNNPSTGVNATASGLSALTTRVTNTENTNTSQGSAITNLQNTVNNPSTGVNATASGLSALTTRVTNTENTNTSQASTLTSLSNSLVALRASIPGGTNLLTNANFNAGTDGWTLSGNAAGRTMVLNNAGTDWKVPGVNNIGVFAGGVPAAGTYADIYSVIADAPAATVGTTYMASVWAGTHRATATAYMYFANSAGTIIQFVGMQSATGYAAGSLANVQRLYCKAAAPSGTSYVGIMFRTSMTGESNPYSWFMQPMVEECSDASQALPSAWNAGGNSAAKAIQSLTARVTSTEGNISSQSSLITSLQNTVNNPSTGVNATASAVSNLSTNINTLTGKVNAQYTLSLNANGYVSGFQSTNSGAVAEFTILADKFKLVTPGSSPKIPFAVASDQVQINTDLYMGNGRIIAQSGGFMKVQGVGFGSANQFIEWFGPVMALNQCTEANGISWEKTNGQAYFGGTGFSGSDGTVKVDNASYVTGDGYNASNCTFQLDNTGVLTVLENNSITNARPANSWLTPVNATLASTYEVMVTPTSGSFTSSAGNGVWLSLSTTRAWSVFKSGTTGGGFKACTFNVQIRKSGTTTILANNNITITAYGDTGGFVDDCVLYSSYLPDGRQAGDVLVGDTLQLAHHETLEGFEGEVQQTYTIWQPCVRIATASAALGCSLSAPIPVRTADGGYKHAGELLEGDEVAVMVNGEKKWEAIESITDIGRNPVQHITVQDECFWAGEGKDAFILHHNIRYKP